MILKIFKKTSDFVSNKIRYLLETKLIIILAIAFFNYIPYGISRYFLGKYNSFPLFTKIGKILVGYFNFVLFILFILFILSFFKNNIEKIIISIFLYFSLFIFFIEVFLIKNFHCLINSSIVQIIFETNFNEAKEFLISYIRLKQVIFFIISCLLIFFIKKVSKQLKKKFNIANKIYLGMFILILVIGGGGLSNYKRLSISRLYFAFQTGISDLREYKKIENNLKDFNVEIIENNSKIDNIILIIGESTTRNHMSLYGYQLETNPLLKKLEQEGNLYKFNDVISPHAHTIPSIKKILTFYNLESKEEWYKYNNIIDIMRIAGYNTYWLSNQEISGIFGNITSALGKKSEYVLFNSFRNSRDEEVIKDIYDENLVYKSIPYIKTNKNFIIYHLMGTHSSYKYRYPKEFEKFKNKKNRIIAEYDNAVFYNDFVINEIINNFKDKESIIIYLSDHGEEVYDFREFCGHAEDNGSRYMIEIPFIIYVSEKLKNNFPELENRIKQSINNPYMSDDLIHTILDIAGIKTKEYDSSRSIINNEFNFKRERVFSGERYDEYWKNKN